MCKAIIVFSFCVSLVAVAVFPSPVTASAVVILGVASFNISVGG